MLWATVAVGALLAILLVHPAGRARCTRAAQKAWLRGVSLLGRMKAALMAYCSRPWTLLWALLLTVVGQSIVTATFWWLGRKVGIDAGLRYYLVAFPLGWVVGAIPISIAGLGITELGTVGFFCHLTGLPREKVLVLVFCQRFIWVLVSLPGGLVHLLGAHLPEEEISIDGPEHTN